MASVNEGAVEAVMHNIATGKAASRPKTSHDALALGVSNGRRQASRAAGGPNRDRN